MLFLYHFNEKITFGHSVLADKDKIVGNKDIIHPVIFNHGNISAPLVPPEVLSFFDTNFLTKLLFCYSERDNCEYYLTSEPGHLVHHSKIEFIEQDPDLRALEPPDPRLRECSPPIPG